MAGVPFHLVDHPLAHDALAELRDARTPPAAFRGAAHRISLIVAAEALRDLPTEADTVATPVGPADARIVRADIVIVPVLRAGLGMVESILELVPRARVGHIGLQRDEETAHASRYYSRLPPGSRQRGAAGRPDAGHRRERRGRGGHHQERRGETIRMMCVVAAPEGVAAMTAAHPDVDIYSPALDASLNARKFIVPGLGDFGDRLYGTI
jgi:uracil phosphoribosyltransferase